MNGTLTYNQALLKALDPWDRDWSIVGKCPNLWQSILSDEAGLIINQIVSDPSDRPLLDITGLPVVENTSYIGSDLSKEWVAIGKIPFIDTTDRPTEFDLVSRINQDYPALSETAKGLEVNAGVAGDDNCIIVHNKTLNIIVLLDSNDKAVGCIALPQSFYSLSPVRKQANVGLDMIIPIVTESMYNNKVYKRILVTMASKEK